MPRYIVHEAEDKLAYEKHKALYQIAYEYFDDVYGDKDELEENLQETFNLASRDSDDSIYDSPSYYKIFDYDFPSDDQSYPGISRISHAIFDREKRVFHNPSRKFDFFNIFLNTQRFNHSENILRALNTLTDKGISVVYMAAKEYPKLYELIKKTNTFYLNAVIGIHDERDDCSSNRDEETLIPVKSKLLCIVISRTKTKYVYLGLEGNDTGYIKFKELFDGIRDEETSNILSYKELISGKDAYVNFEDIADIALYYSKLEYLSKVDKSLNVSKKISDIADCFGIQRFFLWDLSNKIYKDGFLDKSFLEKYHEEINSQYKTYTIFNDYDTSVKILEHLKVVFKKKSNFNKDNLKDILIVRTYLAPYANSKLDFVWLNEWNPDFYELDADEIEYHIIFSKEISLSYLKLFLESDKGRVSLKYSLNNQNELIDAIGNTQVEIIEKDSQEVLASAIQSLNRLSQDLKNLNQKIIDNPSNAKEIDTTLNDWLKRLDKLSLDKKLLNLISQGESQTVEFKSTFSLDLKNESKENFIEHSCFKTIAGFLNNKGGTLLVGVSDEGELLNLPEIEKFHKGSRDDFKLYFLNKLRSKNNINEQFLPLIKYDLIEISHKILFYVICQQSSEPCYLTLNGKDMFYTRQNPGTIELNGQEMVKYIQNRFYQ